MRKFYLECGIARLLYGHEIGGQGSIQGVNILLEIGLKIDCIFVNRTDANII